MQKSHGYSGEHIDICLIGTTLNTFKTFVRFVFIEVV